MGSSLIVEEETTCGRDGLPGRRLQTRESLGLIPMLGDGEPSGGAPTVR